MGAYNDKLSYEERWQVIHYVRSLQAKESKLAYDHLTNTLDDYATPGGAEVMTYNVELPEGLHEHLDGTQHGEDGHHHEDGEGHHDDDDHGEERHGHDHDGH